jgi:hypothetical protein
MGKLLLNLALGKPLALVKKFPYFDDSIELDLLLVGSFHLCIHDLIKFSLIKVVRFEFIRGQVLNYL